MAIKTYTVREGFSFRKADEKGNMRVFFEGNEVELDESEGDSAHQLERLKKRASKAEEIKTPFDDEAKPV